MSQPTNGEQLQLLRTKLYRPRPVGDLVHRTRLSELLDRYSDRAVTLICAPAGFGKTTLLSDWLENCDCPSAWLSLDKSDGELPVFLTYFVAAIRTLFPTACANTLALLEAAVLPPLTSLVTAIVNDLDSLADDAGPDSPLPPGRRFVLVLDDYHLIREPAINGLLAQLMRFPPRTMHLILSARQDPAFLELSSRARADFSEIRAAELRFTPDEAGSLLEQSLQRCLDPKTVEALVDSTEGWGTGLRLTALTMKAGGDLRAPEVIADNRYTSDYLVAEVLSRVPAATQDFLLQTSILDRLSGSLCDAVAPPADPSWDGRSFLEWLAAENVFTFALDGQGTWYRYHHLFQKLLRTQLERRRSAEEVAHLHVRASEWFAQCGLIQEAIEHALAAGNDLMAVELVEKHRYPIMNAERWRQLEQWLGMLPQRLIDRRPELLVLEAWILQSQWRFKDLPAYLDRIEALLDQWPGDSSGCARLQGEVDVLRSMALYYLLDWKGSFACAERALAALPPECSVARGFAWMYYANGRVIEGDMPGAIEAARQGLKEDRLHGNGFSTRLYVAFCQLYLMQADPANLWLAATQLLQLGEQRDLPEARGWAHYFRGCARYQQNDLAGAEPEFAAVVRQPYLAHAHPFSQSAFGLAMTLAGMGQYDRARQVVESAAAYGLEMNNERVLVDAAAIRACLARRTGNIAEAHRWASSFDPNTPLVPLTTFSVPHLVRVRILVAEGSPASLAAAARDLAPVYDLAVSSYNTRYMAETLALKALIYEGHGDQAAAFAALAEALGLAEPGGLIRQFVDLGPNMRALLDRYRARAGANEYLQTLLAAFEPVAASAEVTRQVATPPVSQPRAAMGPAPTNGLIEPLSSRELDVLLLLSERLTDKEIARELVVSPQTVKRHAANIYQKLDVGNRREAVAKATSYGLLPAVPPAPRRSLPSRP